MGRMSDMPVGEEAAEIRRFWEALSLPGLVDVHTHFMPERVLHKVWEYFDGLGPLTGGMEWPITYRHEEAERALLFLEAACRGHVATPELAEGVGRFLDRAANDRRLRFDPERVAHVLRISAR